MASLTADAPFDTRQPNSLRYPIADGVKVYRGSWLAVDASGFVTPFDGSADLEVIGQCLDGENGRASTPQYLGLGDTSLDPDPAATINVDGYVADAVTVVGTSSAADRGKPVYLAGDDHTLTIVRPTATKPVQVGEVLRWGSGTTCDVLIYSLERRNAPTAKRLLNLGTFAASLLANGNARTSIPAPFHGRILSVYAMIDQAPAGASGTALLNLEIGGTNVTGGVVTIATGDARGDKKSGTTVTAANEFHEGDLIDVEASSVTSMSAGTFDLFAEVEVLPGT